MHCWQMDSFATAVLASLANRSRPYTFNSFLKSLRKRQSVPRAMTF